MRRRRRATPGGQALNHIRWATRVLVGPPARLAAEGDRAAELLRAQDPAAVWHFWEWNRVRLLATHRAHEVNLATDLWDDHAGPLADFARERAVQQELAALKVTRILARDGIRSLVLKGPGLAKRLYGDAALRDPSGDVDVLVAAGNLPRANALLQEHGWTQTLEALTQGDLPELHFALLGPDGMPHVELHWRMQWYERFAHTSELLQRAVEIDGIPRADTRDLPHLMLLFWLRDGFHGLRLAADYAA
ncbi:MAG: nucleotidyltransferase family protein, partial [Solirubrobacteraceae bacterium]|nr:nucleotidyltransferase family protein [Solirubrobacteraceae bacterium]